MGGVQWGKAYSADVGWEIFLVVSSQMGEVMGEAWEI